MLLIQNGHIKTMAGTELENGCVLIGDDGKIVCVAEHIPAPEGAEIIDAAKYYDPARITRYTQDLATQFHKFYNACRVKGESEDLMQARLSLCVAARTTLRNALTMMKIGAPEAM